MADHTYSKEQLDGKVLEFDDLMKTVVENHYNDLEKNGSAPEHSQIGERQAFYVDGGGLSRIVGMKFFWDSQPNETVEFNENQCKCSTVQELENNLQLRLKMGVPAKLYAFTGVGRLVEITFPDNAEDKITVHEMSKEETKQYLQNRLLLTQKKFDAAIDKVISIAQADARHNKEKADEIKTGVYTKTSINPNTGEKQTIKKTLTKEEISTRWNQYKKRNEQLKSNVQILSQIKEQIHTAISKSQLTNRNLSDKEQMISAFDAGRELENARYRIREVAGLSTGLSMKEKVAEATGGPRTKAAAEAVNIPFFSFSNLYSGVARSLGLQFENLRDVNMLGEAEVATKQQKDLGRQNHANNVANMNRQLTNFLNSFKETDGIFTRDSARYKRMKETISKVIDKIGEQIESNKGPTKKDLSEYKKAVKAVVRDYYEYSNRKENKNSRSQNRENLAKQLLNVLDDKEKSTPVASNKTENPQAYRNSLIRIVANGVRMQMKKAEELVNNEYESVKSTEEILLNPKFRERYEKMDLAELESLSDRIERSGSEGEKLRGDAFRDYIKDCAAEKNRDAGDSSPEEENVLPLE